MNTRRTVVIMALVAGAAGLACRGGSDTQAGATPPLTTSSPATTAPAPAIASGGAVTVPRGYEPPKDRVPSTGASIPVNGKPTLVYVDAIW